MRVEFGWDSNKHEATLRDRGFGFDLAMRIFEGETLEAIDDRHDYGEIRVKGIGEVEGRVLTVVYTDRDNVRWIISAWPASRRERRLWQTR